MIHTSIFRVASYSISTSRITAHVERAADLHKFLEAEGILVEPMVEASGTVLRGYRDESGQMRVDVEPEIVTFVADATPVMLQPLLQRWCDGQEFSGAAAQNEKNQQDRNGNADQP